MLEKMKGSPAEEEKILRETSWVISKKAIGSAVGVTAIVLYWLIYFWQDSLAWAGDYRYFSYSFHEVYTTGYFLVPLVTAVWFGRVIIKAVKKRTWRKNIALGVVLAVLLLGQIGYLQDRSRMVYVTNWTEVAAIPDAYHVVIESAEGRITLETTPLVTALLKADGTIYGFEYERYEDITDEGKLNCIWDTVE